MTEQNCKYKSTCFNYKEGSCVGCNVYNYTHDIEKLKEWCVKQNKDFILFTMEMQKELAE